MTLYLNIAFKSGIMELNPEINPSLLGQRDEWKQLTEKGHPSIHPCHYLNNQAFPHFKTSQLRTFIIEPLARVACGNASPSCRGSVLNNSSTASSSPMASKTSGHRPLRYHPPQAFSCVAHVELPSLNKCISQQCIRKCTPISFFPHLPGEGC